MADSRARLKQLLIDANLDKATHEALIAAISKIEQDHTQQLDAIQRNINATVYEFARDFFNHSRMLAGYLHVLSDIEDFNEEQIEILNNVQNDAQELLSKTQTLMHVFK